MGEFDQRALWEYVQQKTGEEKIFYIGHSQGTAQMFAAMATDPQFYRERMQLFVAIAPILRIQNLNSKLI